MIQRWSQDHITVLLAKKDQVNYKQDKFRIILIYEIESFPKEDEGSPRSKITLKECAS